MGLLLYYMKSKGSDNFHARYQMLLITLLEILAAYRAPLDLW